MKGQGDNESHFAIYLSNCDRGTSRHHLLFAHVSRARRTFELDRYIGIAISVPVSRFFNKVTSQGSTARTAAEIIPRSAFSAIVIRSVGLTV